MKKTTIFLLLVALTSTTFSQQTDPPPSLTKQDYLGKSKQQKSAAWLLLGAGATVLVVTGVSNFKIDFNNTNKDPFPIVPVVIGSAMMVGSVPLFIASGRNKKKGMSVSFKNEVAPQVQDSSFVYRSVPSLNLKINL